MTRDQALKIKVGDLVKPIKLWNETERKDKLATKCIVKGINEGQSQTGVFFEVICLSGAKRWLDAGWFDECV